MVTVGKALPLLTVEEASWIVGVYSTMLGTEVLFAGGFTDVLCSGFCGGSLFFLLLGVYFLACFLGDHSHYGGVLPLAVTFH